MPWFMGLDRRVSEAAEGRAELGFEFSTPSHGAGVVVEVHLQASSQDARAVARDNINFSLGSRHGLCAELADSCCEATEAGSIGLPGRGVASGVSSGVGTESTLTFRRAAAYWWKAFMMFALCARGSRLESFDGLLHEHRH